ncbi:MAG: PAS domain S-box protein [Deltaproteobacteria bacterium]|nr:PAS domain S-box protein [Deltaproteobacteria bacterium]
MADLTATTASTWELLEAMPDALVVVGRDGRIQLVNEQTLDLFGYGRAELIGQPLEVLLPERFRHSHLAHRSSYFGDPKRRPMGRALELFGRRKDGTEFSAEISLAPTQSEEGVFVIVGVRNVTERKRAEAMILAVEARYHSLLDNMLEAAQILSFEWRYLYLNDAAARHGRQVKAEMLGRTVMERFPGFEATEMFASLRRCMEQRTASHAEFELNYPDGTRGWFEFSIQPVPEGLFILSLDITARKRMQQKILALNAELEQRVEARTAQLARAKEAAEAANRELESFSYSVAHDLRAPLRSIDGFSQALLEDYAEKLDDDGKKYFTFIRESAQHMAQLIDDLLSLSRVTRSELQRERVDLSALAHACIARLQRSSPGRHVNVDIQDGLGGEGDPRLLAVVLENLLGNAWKFTGKRAEARIEFGATSTNECPVFFVRDSGAGFDMAFADKLFGAFQRLHGACEFEGTGVGLATVQRVIGRHGGRVWAEGEVDRGATFYFTLPETERGE